MQRATRGLRARSASATVSAKPSLEKGRRHHHATYKRARTPATSSGAPHAQPMPAYEEQRAEFETARSDRRGDLGQPEASWAAIRAIVDAADPPLRVFIGKYAFDWAKADYAARLAEWERWQSVAVESHGTEEQ